VNTGSQRVSDSIRIVDVVRGIARHRSTCSGNIAESAESARTGGRRETSKFAVQGRHSREFLVYSRKIRPLRSQGGQIALDTWTEYSESKGGKVGLRFAYLREKRDPRLCRYQSAIITRNQAGNRSGRLFLSFSLGTLSLAKGVAIQVHEQAEPLGSWRSAEIFAGNYEFFIPTAFNPNFVTH